MPWVKNFNAMKTNTRCSMGAVLLPSTRYMKTERFDLTQGVSTPMIRPVFRFQLEKPQVGGSIPDLSVFLVHLVSGWAAGAQDELNSLISQMTTLIPQGTAAVIVGDMNINLLTNVLTLPPGWYFLRTGVATQQSGGELDYALLYDPKGLYAPTATVAILQQFKTGNNQSDHSVLQYTIPQY